MGGEAELGKRTMRMKITNVDSARSGSRTVSQQSSTPPGDQLSQNRYPGRRMLGHPALVKDDQRRDAASLPSQLIAEWITRSTPSSNHTGIGEETTPHDSAQGVCLGDRDIPPRAVGGEVEWGKRSTVQGEGWICSSA